MARYLKKAVRSFQEQDLTTQQTVSTLLDDIRQGGEATVRNLALKFDNWNRDFIMKIPTLYFSWNQLKKTGNKILDRPSA